MATVKLLATLWDDGRRGRGRGPHRAGCRHPRVQRGDAPRRGRPACRGEPDRHAGRSSAASGTSPRSRSPASTRRASRTPPTPSAPEVAVVISARVAPGQPAREAYAAIEAHLRAHAPFGAQLDVQRSGLRRRRSSSTPAAGRSGRPGRDARGVRRRNRWRSASAGRSRSSPTWCASSPARRSSSPASRTRTRARTAPTSRCTCETFRNAVLAEALLLEKLDARTRRTETPRRRSATTRA